MRKIINIILLSTLCSLFFAACQNPLSPVHDSIGANVGNNTAANAPEGYGAFTISRDSAARTILPTTPAVDGFERYTLTFTRSSPSTASVSQIRTPGNLFSPTYLEAGTWKLEVSAYYQTSDTYAAAQGTVPSFDVVGGTTTSAVLTLNPIMSGAGSGTFSWKIGIGFNPTSANMSITPRAGGSGTTINLLNKLADGKSADSHTLSPGQYTVLIEMGSTTSGQKLSYRDILHVYQSLPSHFERDFVEADFTRLFYTVTFNYNDGLPNSEQERTVLAGSTVSEPAATRDGYVFGGWYRDNNTFATAYNFSTSVTGNLNLYAKWTLKTLELSSVVSETYTPVESVANIQQAMDHVNTLANAGEYRAVMIADEEIAPQKLENLNTNINSTLTITTPADSTSERKIKLNTGSTSALFTVTRGKLVVMGNVTLDGNNANTVAQVNANTTFELNGSAKITGGNATYSGGGANVAAGGIFTMNGGEISGNTAGSGGGGVYVDGTFTMNGGTISNNKATTNGGGVYVTSSGGTFRMIDGIIYGIDETTDTSLRNTTTTNNGMTLYINTGIGSATYGIAPDGDDGDIPVTGNAQNNTIEVQNGNLIKPAGGRIGVLSGSGAPVDVFTLTDVTDLVNTTAGAYTLTLERSTNAAPQTLTGAGSTLTIKSTAPRTISLESNGALFTVGSGVTLILDNNITLKGRSGNNNSVVQVNSGGTLTMNSGSTITGNTGNTSSYGKGGGVYVDINGTFIMNSGTICDNTASSSGGGGGVSTAGTFTMKNGSLITGNATTSNDGHGGGVAVTGGTFTMTGGEISKNTSAGNSGGAGVIVASGTFTMNSGTICDNTTPNGGGGVLVQNNGAAFIMNNGTICDNTASSGGGVYLQNGSFTMNDGTITGNTATGTNSGGGGVYLQGGSFTKTGGTITGYTTDPVNGNRAASNVGHAVFVYGGNPGYGAPDNPPKYYSDTTMGPGTNYPPPGSSADNPLPINNLSELMQMSDPGGNELHYKLMADITLPTPAAGQGNWTPVGVDYSVPFTGSFDGNNYSIINMVVVAESPAGMFGWLGDNNVSRIVIKNLTLEECSISTSDSNAGGIAGFRSYSYDGEISNCSVSGSINGVDHIGGIVGYNNGLISNCTFSGNVKGQGECIGGIAGYIESSSSTIENCSVTGSVKGDSYYTGGITGRSDNGTISNCFVSASVEGSADFIGGIVGKNDGGTVENCYTIGNVKGGDYIGGIVGKTEYSGCEIKNCYTTGDVEGNNYVGGIAGENQNQWGNDDSDYGRSVINNCYATGNITATGNKAGGLVGNNGNFGRVRNSVALNLSVTANSGSGDAGRVAGGAGVSSLSNNYARDNMLLNNVPSASSTDASDQDGADITNWYNLWWTSAPPNGPGFDLNVWNNATATRLPTLQDMPAGTQNPQVQ